MPLEPGSTLGRYTILEQVGRGGMATVYRAMQTSLNRPVAIKVLPEFFASEPGFRERFQQEAVAIAQFRHPNILAVYEYGQSDGVDYIVTELVDGGTLASRLGQPLALSDVVTLLTPVASAIDYAHQHGVIHRDIKPSNILITGDGTPVLSDFGMARTVSDLPRFTQTGSVIGTPEYMSPEQAAGEDASAASDLYALAVVAYEMLTGRPPFTGPTPLSVLLAHLNTPLPPPRDLNAVLPESAQSVLEKALSKAPADRYETAQAFVGALASAGAAAVPTPEAPKPERPARPGRAAAAATTEAAASEDKKPAAAKEGAAAVEAKPKPAAEPASTGSGGSKRMIWLVAGAAGAIVAVVVAVFALSSGGGKSSPSVLAAQPTTAPTSPAVVPSVAPAAPSPAPTAAVAATTAPAPPPQAADVLYSDDFSDASKSAFGTSRGQGTSPTGIDFMRDIQDGALSIRLVKGLAGRSFLSPNAERQSPTSPLIIKTPGAFAVDVDAQATGKAAQLDYGIAFNADVPGGLRLHILPGSGTAVLNVNIGEKVTNLVRVANSAVNQGEAVNHLRLEVRGTAVTLLVNGKTIGTYNDASLSQRPTTIFLLSGVDNAPIVAADNARITFDNLKLTSLN